MEIHWLLKGYKVFEEGTYSHTEEIRPGCFEQTILHLDVLPPLFINDVSIMADDGHNNGAIIVEIGGGTPPYSYHWNTGQTSESLFNISTGNYSQTVTDANGCVEVFLYEVPFVNATHDAGKQVPLSCRPNLLHPGDKLRLVNSGKENISISKLELTSTSGQSIWIRQKINVPGEAYYYEQVPSSLLPGIYVLSASLKNGQAFQWKIVIE
jgi:hypothetical protein